MQFLARRLGEDEKEWALAGLLHDIDYEKLKMNPQSTGGGEPKYSKKQVFLKK